MDGTNIILSGTVPDDYTQSSNSLFHFMKHPDYLRDAITRKALLPRYCEENIEFLNLSNNGLPFKEMAILMKCFCDIPLHKITQAFECSVQPLNDKNVSRRTHSHTSIYGEFALAFSKSWGEHKGIEPINYHIPKSEYLNKMSSAINQAISDDGNMEELIADNFLYQLAFLKSIRGQMPRKSENGYDQIVSKNFHDEHEWRYVPATSFNENNELAPIIANPNILHDISDLSTSPLDLLSNKLSDRAYHDYWLKFEYDDIRYIIVPDKHALLDIIKLIDNLDDSQFNETIEKYILISKIIVLDQIRKDW